MRGHISKKWMNMGSPEWKRAAGHAERYRDNSIQRVAPAVPPVPHDLPLNVIDIPKQLLLTEEASLTSLPPERLIQALAAGEVTAVQVTTAFLRRAGIAQSLVQSSSRAFAVSG